MERQRDIWPLPKCCFKLFRCNSVWIVCGWSECYREVTKYYIEHILWVCQHVSSDSIKSEYTCLNMFRDVKFNTDNSVHWKSKKKISRIFLAVKKWSITCNKLLSHPLQSFSGLVQSFLIVWKHTISMTGYQNIQNFENKISRWLIQLLHFNVGEQTKVWFVSISYNILYLKE